MLRDDDPYRIIHADCIPTMLEAMEPASMDMAVFSPPFPSLFSYTDKEEDIGNSEDLRSEAKLHLSWFFRGLRRVMKPGRIVTMHVQQIPGLLRNGELGTFDFRGLCIKLAERAGLIYHYDWLVRKNPQAQAIRTHSHKLLFVTLERDRAMSCGAFCDYLIKFIVPGTNAVPICSPEITREQWIDWAEGSWADIRETQTLNAREAKGEQDTKHICPLQLEVIRRLCLLYSNPDEIVFSPFAGIGSEGHEALKLGRRFLGIELKDEYVAAARKNLDRVLKQKKQSERTLFDAIDKPTPTVPDEEQEVIW